MMNMKSGFGDADNRVTVIRSGELEHVPLVCVNYRDLTITGRDKKVRNLIKSRLPGIKDRYGSGDWMSAPIFRGYVELHDRYTRKKGLAGSSQTLIEFVLKNGFMPNINSFVDMYNLVSVLTGISVGAHDIRALKGAPALEIIKQDTSFRVIGANSEAVARKGEYCYVDEAGILCRMDVKQCERTKITEDTTDVLVIFQGHEYLDAGELEKGVQLLDQLWKGL